MNAKAIVTGLGGLLLLASSAFADPPLSSAEKAYQLLQSVSSQLREAQEALGSRSATPAAAALATAEEQVRIAFTHCCHALYAAHLEAAKVALTQHDQQQALHHLLKADETLGKCAEHPLDAEPQTDQEALAFRDALEHR